MSEAVTRSWPVDPDWNSLPFLALSGPHASNSAGPLVAESYVTYAGTLGREGFCKALDAYRFPRPFGNKQHLRRTDTLARSLSPQKLFGIPVGKTFFEGAPRLLRSGVTIPALQAGDPIRIVVEAYGSPLRIPRRPCRPS